MINKRWDLSFMRKTWNCFSRMGEKLWFSGAKNASAKRIYLPDWRPHNWKSCCLMVRQRSAVFFPHLASRPFRASIYIVAGWPGPFLSLGVGAVGETPCLNQEAGDGGVVSAQAAHSWCHCYAFLLPGHKPQFFNYWNFFKTSSSNFTVHILNNCNKKKKGWCHGRLRRSMWTD